jgi:glutathione peroxidase-family protein
MNIYDLKVKQRNGEDFDWSTLTGKEALVVNTATGCW